MGKAEVVQAGMAAIQQGQMDALGACYDQGLADGQALVPAPAPGLSQEDIDKSVQAQKDADSLVAAGIQAQLDAVLAKDAMIEDVLGKLKDLLGQIGK